MVNLFETLLIAAGMGGYMAVDIACYIYDSFAGQKYVQKKNKQESSKLENYIQKEYPK